MAKETSVGGTSMSSNEPDMESLPPIAARHRFSCAVYAPSRADSGLPNRFGSLPRRSKYSWKVRYAVSKSQPAATSLETDSITAAEAPRYGFCSVKYGSKPKAMTDAVSH